jgi:hypothetical protein
MLLAAAAAVHDDPSDDPTSSQGNGMGVFAQVRPGTGLVQLGDSQASPRRGRPPISTVLEEAARVAVTCVKLHYDGTPSFHVTLRTRQLFFNRPDENRLLRGCSPNPFICPLLVCVRRLGGQCVVLVLQPSPRPVPPRRDPAPARPLPAPRQQDADAHRGGHGVWRTLGHLPDPPRRHGTTLSTSPPSI